MGLLERLRQADVPEETLEEKTAHDALEKIEDRISQISPFRVIFASITAFLVLSASVIALVWLVPYDRVSVDVIYKQAGSSHIVLSEINNQGSRAIESVSLDLVFIDSEDIEIISDFVRQSMGTGDSGMDAAAEYLSHQAAMSFDEALDVIDELVAYDEVQYDSYNDELYL